MKKVENISEAVNILIDAANVGQSKGAYSFAESAIIGQALNWLKENSEKPTNKEED